MSEEIDSLKEEEKERMAAAEEAYRQKQTAEEDDMASQEAAPERSRSRSSQMTWLPGLILIGLGVIFLLNNLTGFELHNWWALFILIPAVSSFGRAAGALRVAGEFNRQVWGGLASGLFFTLIASAFLFDLDWGMIWPAFLIIGGLGLIFGALKSK